MAPQRSNKDRTRLEALEYSAFLLGVLLDECRDPDWDYNRMFENQDGLIKECEEVLNELSDFRCQNTGHAPGEQFWFTEPEEEDNAAI